MVRSHQGALQADFLFMIYQPDDLTPDVGLTYKYPRGSLENRMEVCLDNLIKPCPVRRKLTS